MVNKTDMIVLQMLKLASARIGVHFDDRFITHYIKSKLTPHQLIKFNKHVRSNSMNLYEFTEEADEIKSIALTRRSFDFIYCYDAAETETKIINALIELYKIYSIKLPGIDRLPFQVIEMRIGSILNPKEVEDRCIQKAVKKMVLEGLLLIDKEYVIFTEMKKATG